MNDILTTCDLCLKDSGIKLSDKQRQMLSEFYEGDYRELVAVLGRRSGKDLLSTLILVHELLYLTELPNPYEYYEGQYHGLPYSDPIHLMVVCPSSDQARILQSEFKTRFIKIPSLKERQLKSTKENEFVFSLNVDGSAAVYFMGASSFHSKGLLGPNFAEPRSIYTLMLNELGCYKQPEEVFALRSRTSGFYPVSYKTESKTIVMSSATTIGSFLEQLVVAPSNNDRLTYQLPTWEVNEMLTEENLRRQNRYMSSEDFMCEFGSQFKEKEEVVESTTVSIRLPQNRIEALKKIAREKAYKDDAEISYVDLIRNAVDKEYFSCQGCE